ncbi:hypothetical protein [Sediminicola arcticus]|uniref:Uncharacterized protein n=1 Tax=Sediminicola arcticus TaxID=1574308 RepID=A0ABV2SUG4_9FLAO
MDKEQAQNLEELQKLSSATKNLGKQLHAITPNFYPFDLFLIAALNRTINLNRAFIELSKENNFIAAAPLVRINLDTYLRLYAPRVSNLEFNEFASKVIFEQKKINNLKSTERTENGKLKSLSDNFLKNSISQIEGCEWVAKIYDAGSSFIHLDSNMFFASRKVNSEEEKTISLTIGYHDSFVPQSEKTGAAFWMNKITEGIIEQAMLWIAEKANDFGFDIKKLNNLDDLNNQKEE